MIRRWRRRVLLAVVGAAVVAAVVLLTTRSWSGDTLVQEAAAGTIEYRLCDTVVPMSPENLDMIAPSLIDGQPFLTIRSGRSAVSIDPQTGTVLNRKYDTPSDEVLLEDVLSGLLVETRDPVTWPYTNVTQVPAKRLKVSVFEYRAPDPGSGLVKSSLAAGSLQALIIQNCRSKMTIEATLGKPGIAGVVRDIHPNDRAAFQRFLDEVEVKGLD